MKKYYFEESPWGRRLVLTSPWDHGILKKLKKEKYQGLYLNSALGWSGKDFSFLEYFKDIDSLDIVCSRIEDLSPLYQLNQLKHLKFPGGKKEPFDFTKFLELESCLFDWWPGAKSIFDVKQLKDLYIYELKLTDTELFRNLKNLEKLEFGLGPVSNLEGLSDLKNLKSLALFYLSKLESLDGIHDLKALEFLRISNCKKINSLEHLRNLVNLKTLHIFKCDYLDSLKPLENCKKLEWLLLTEGTYLRDYDLELIFRLPSLKKFSFTEHKNYKYKNKQLKVCYGSPEGLNETKEALCIPQDQPPFWEDLL